MRLLTENTIAEKNGFFEGSGMVIGSDF
jgi:hypothetical protein